MVVLDVSLPDMSGLDVAAHVRRDDAAVSIVFLSAYDDEEIKRAAEKAGGHAYVVKSQLSDLVDVVLRTAAAGSSSGGRT